MKKIIMIFLMCCPFTSIFGVNLDMRNQMLDYEIEKLTKERDSKYEALKKCEKSTTGFKIAGITTLVATGVGVYGNIKLAEKLKTKSKSNSSSGGKSAAVVDNRPQEEKNDDSCKVLCDVDAAPAECSC